MSRTSRVNRWRSAAAGVAIAAASFTAAACGADEPVQESEVGEVEEGEGGGEEGEEEDD